MTMRLSRGNSTLTFFRLCSRAPRTMILSFLIFLRLLRVRRDFSLE